MNYTDNFEWAWMRRPKRDGGDSKANAFKAWNARLKAGHTERSMTEGLMRYGRWLNSRGQVGTKYVMQTATFFGPGEHFTELWEITKPENTSTRNVSVQEGLNDRSWAYVSDKTSSDTSWAVGVDS